MTGPKWSSIASPPQSRARVGEIAAIEAKAAKGARMRLSDEGNRLFFIPSRTRHDGPPPHSRGLFKVPDSAGPPSP